MPPNFFLRRAAAKAKARAKAKQRTQRSARSNGRRARRRKAVQDLNTLAEKRGLYSSQVAVKGGLPQALFIIKNNVFSIKKSPFLGWRLAAGAFFFSENLKNAFTGRKWLYGSYLVLSEVRIGFGFVRSTNWLYGSKRASEQASKRASERASERARK